MPRDEGAEMTSLYFVMIVVGFAIVFRTVAPWVCWLIGVAVMKLCERNKRK